MNSSSTNPFLLSIKDVRDKLEEEEDPHPLAADRAELNELIHIEFAYELGSYSGWNYHREDDPYATNGNQRDGTFLEMVPLSTLPMPNWYLDYEPYRGRSPREVSRERSVFLYAKYHPPVAPPPAPPPSPPPNPSFRRRYGGRVKTVAKKSCSTWPMPRPGFRQGRYINVPSAAPTASLMRVDPPVPISQSTPASAAEQKTEDGAEGSSATVSESESVDRNSPSAESSAPSEIATQPSKDSKEPSPSASSLPKVKIPSVAGRQAGKRARSNDSDEEDFKANFMRKRKVTNGTT